MANRRTSASDTRSSTFAMAQAPWLACVVILWLLTGLTGDEWFAFGACLAAASLLYAVVRAMRHSSPKTEI
jgi:hypothetical protein